MTVKLPLPRFARRPTFFLGLAVVHLYLGGGHILALFDTGVTWTDTWKGFGAVAGTYYFTALGLRERGAASASPGHVQVGANYTD